MLKAGVKILITLIALFLLYRCIDPYFPKLNGLESYLVVEGLITDANTSYTVKLSKTLKNRDAIPVMISDASVSVSENESRIINLKNMGSGIYRTDSIEFQGVIGNTYILHIKTSEGAGYESEPYAMESVPEIDSIYYAKDQELSNNGTVTNSGIRIYLDSKEGNNNKYYRWDYEETWKFKVPNPQKYNYINDSTILPVDDVKEYCWKKGKSNEILINTELPGQNARIVNEPIVFIDPAKSDRLLIQYSILARQYSISKKEFDFWDSMKKINDKGGDIFAYQPFPVISNVHNVNDPNEIVLGYFEVSAVTQKRKNIPFSEIVGLNLPFFKYPCYRDEKAPADYAWTPWVTTPTWDHIYEIYISSDYYFVEPIYIPGTADSLFKLVFTRPECANCELTGTRIKPDFWVDLN